MAITILQITSQHLLNQVRLSRDSGRDSAAPSVEYFSVLIKHAQDQDQQQHQHEVGSAADKRGENGCVQEVYRVKLPGNPVVGEGKPENQNHAVIFTRGEHLQAIDMNQEG